VADNDREAGSHCDYLDDQQNRTVAHQRGDDVQHGFFLRDHHQTEQHTIEPDQLGEENRQRRAHHASRPRSGRPSGLVSRTARCSASCLSNIALAAALRLALNSARLSPHHS